MTDPHAGARREHVTSGYDCWCFPRYFVPCDECATGCWKCDGGKIWLTKAQAEAETRAIVVVHDDPDEDDDPGDDTNAGACQHGIGFDERCELCESEEGHDGTTSDF